MTQLKRLVELLEDGGVWRMAELARKGFTATAVSRAVGSGAVERLSRGTYRRADAIPSAHADLALAAARCPGGVVCLLSAAAYHGLGDLVPNEIWIAIPNRSRPPRMDWPSVRPVRWRSPEALVTGVLTARISGVDVRMTDPARTVVDLLRMKSTVGEDRAAEATRDYVRSSGSLHELRATAERLGVGRRLAPVLGALAMMGG